MLFDSKKEWFHSGFDFLSIPFPSQIYFIVLKRRKKIPLGSFAKGDFPDQKDCVQFLLCMIETLAEHFGGTQHGDERVEVFLMDKLLQLARLPVGEGGVDHIMGLIGVGTKAGSVGSAAHQLAHDEITDGIFVVTDDEDGLAHLDPLQHGVDDQRFHGQTHERVQCCVQVKDEAGRHHHEQVGEEKGYGDAVDVGVFFHDEGNDVRAA